jgi:universal stress protein E
MNFRNILVIVEPGDQQSPALERALALAKCQQAKVHIRLFEYQAAVEAVSYVSKDVSEFARQAVLDEHRRRLDAAAERVRAAGLEASAEVIWGRPRHERMLEVVGELHPDLVIKDIHLEPMLKRVFLTPVDWHLLRDCPAPLLLVNPEARSLPTRIVAGIEPVLREHVDGHLNDRILGAARDLAQRAGARLEVAYSFQVPTPLAIAEPGPFTTAMNEAYEQLRVLHTKHFEDFAAQKEVPAGSRHVFYGPPWITLTDYANDARGDLLVVGTIQRTGLDRLVIGSAAERILGESRCDLLAIKPQGQKRPARKPGAGRRKQQVAAGKAEWAGQVRAGHGVG